MRDLLYLERLEQAETLLKPQRIELLRQLAEPRSCTEVAARLGQTQQRVYYHVKRLVEHELVTQVAERRVHGINEGVYQATARAYWLSPRLVGRIGQRQQRDEASLGYLLDLMEEVQSDVAALHTQAARRPAQHREADHHAEVPHQRSPRRTAGRRAGETDADEPDLPSLGVSGEIRVRPDRRPEFMADLKAALQDLFTRYGGAEGDAFKLAVVCYPDRSHDEGDRSRQGEDRWPR
ncbi:MAG: helix-turn-helix domain-containing protein [Micromonosporaceae bacterium]